MMHSLINYLLLLAWHLFTYLYQAFSTGGSDHCDMGDYAAGGLHGVPDLPGSAHQQTRQSILPGTY